MLAHRVVHFHSRDLRERDVTSYERAFTHSGRYTRNCSSTEHGGPSKKNLADRFLARCGASSLLASQQPMLLAVHCSPAGARCWSWPTRGQNALR